MPRPRTSTPSLENTEAAADRGRELARIKRDLTLERRRQEAEDARTGLPLLKWAEQCYSIRPSEPWVPVRYIADFMATVIAPDVRRVVLWKSSQVGATQAFTALHGWLVGEQDARVVVAMPTELEARKLYRRIISPLHERVDRLAKMQMALPDRRARAGPHRTFPTGAESLVQGATSADRYASFVADLLVLDELDRYPTLDEGDALTLSMRAVRNTNGTVACGSTPTSAYGPSQIVTAWTDSDIMFAFAIPCPLCGERDDLEWERMEWQAEGTRAERASSVRHKCSQCGGLWPYERLRDAVAHGRWQEAELERGREFPSLVRDNPHYVTRHGTLRRGKRKVDWPENVGFAIWAAYSIWHTWPRMVSEWLMAQGSAQKVRAFVEQTLARPFGTDEGGVSDDALRDNATPLDEVPDNHRLSVCVVDVQDGWLAAHVFLCGPDSDVVMVERRDFYGEVDLVDAPAWVEFRRWLASPESVIRQRPVRVLAVDVGFEQSWTIRNMRRIGFSGQIFAVKGRAGWGHSAKFTSTVPIDGVAAKVLMLGVDNLKLTAIQAYRHGRMRLWDGATEDLRQELQAERLIRNERTKKLKWERFHERNEALDCSAYCLGVLDVLRTPDIPNIPLANAPLASGVRRKRRKVGGVRYA